MLGQWQAGVQRAQALFIPLFPAGFLVAVSSTSFGEEMFDGGGPEGGVYGEWTEWMKEIPKLVRPSRMAAGKKYWPSQCRGRL
jgi:hypothetical protein